MGTDSNVAGDWAAAVHKAQADMLRQWTQLGQGVLGAGAALPPTGMSGAAAPDALARQFMQQCEQYLGVSQSLWDLVSRSAAVADPEQRARLFTDGVGTLQQQFTGLWAAASLGMPGAGMAQFGAGFPGAGSFPGAGAAFGLPALGPAREQQEALQKLAQLGMRCVQAQMQVSGQWNDIIGKSLRELAERLAPRLKSGATPGSMKEIYDLWVDSAESVYGQAARAGAFVQAQAELTNATSQLRSAQRELLEEWARQFDLPTRSELNSIHQQLRELKAALTAARG